MFTRGFPRAKQESFHPPSGEAFLPLVQLREAAPWRVFAQETIKEHSQLSEKFLELQERTILWFWLLLRRLYIMLYLLLAVVSM